MNMWWTASRPAALHDGSVCSVHHVSRGVVADAGVLAHEQPDGEDVGLAMDAHAVVGVHVGEDELGVRPLLGHRWNEDDKDEHTCDGGYGWVEDGVCWKRRKDLFTPFTALVALFWLWITGAADRERIVTLALDFRKQMYAPLPLGYYGSSHFTRARADLVSRLPTTSPACRRTSCGVPWSGSTRGSSSRRAC